MAIEARVQGEARNCVLAWHQADHLFHDPCSSATFAPDGTGLVRYPVTVRPSDRLDIDLRQPLPPGTTITTGAPPTTS